MSAKIRKIVTTVEDTVREMDRSVDPVTRKAAAIAIIENPCAGEFVDDLEANVQGALACGFDAVQYTSVAKLDRDLRRAVAIGRRFIDPLSEFVKSDPLHVDLGLNQSRIKLEEFAELFESKLHILKVVR